MKKRRIIAGVVTTLLVSAMFAGCGTQSNNGNDAQTTVPGKNTGSAVSEENSAAEESVSSMEMISAETFGDAQTTGKSLVVYFDYANNIDTTGMDADAISSASLSSGKPKGNTENLKLMAEEIADKKKADVFPVKINEVYAADFDEMAPKAREDIKNGASFTFQSLPENLDQYDVVYVGSPKMEYSL